MKQRYLLPLLLLAPFLAHADALSALGEAQFYFALVMLGVAILVISGFLIVLYSWPRWAGAPYVVGIPLLLLTWVYFNNAYPGREFTLSLVLALLLNGLVWVREFRPRPVRIAGGVAIAGSVAMLAVVLTN
jgi:hypothetical protein